MTKQLTKPESNSLTELQEFKPTPHMFVWLDTQVQLATDVIDEIARQSKISEASWYNWRKLEGFEDWYWAEYDKRVRRWKPLVDSLGVKFAKRGSDKHFEYLARRVGNVQDKQGNQPNVSKRLTVEEFFTE